MYVFMAVLGLHYCSGFSPVSASGGYSLLAVHRLHIEVASPVADHHSLLAVLRLHIEVASPVADQRL